MYIVKLTAALALVSIASAAPANATVITADGLAGTNMAGNSSVYYGGSGTTYTNFGNAAPAAVDGFKLQSTSNLLFITSTYGNNTDTTTRAYNGTDFMMTSNKMTISSQTASPFSVQSLDLKDWDGYVQNAVLTGYFSNGGSISTTLALNSTANMNIAIGNDFTKYALSGFAGLSSFTIQGNTNNWLAIDNIAVNSSAVPEPGTLAIFGLGLAGLAAVRRRKQK
ncbi:PEP-CTERM sorting domain-containing protein [Pseudoduganella sp. LjRoot289]|uniref:PEP-CTERM sorting domain-containing protein n=1 Tax=Pseudoduganella sp. LjRoot289 TaxID=3342314 RepID=UPI003ECFDB67